MMPQHRDTANLPIACTLSPDALRKRREGLLANLLRRAESVERTPEGARVRFRAEGDVLMVIARVIDAERQCCRFLRFAITVEADGGPIVLELSGPPGAGEFIATLVGTSELG